jgi:hypothetical protein
VSTVNILQGTPLRRFKKEEWHSPAVCCIKQPDVEGNITRDVETNFLFLSSALVLSPPFITVLFPFFSSFSEFLPFYFLRFFLSYLLYRFISLVFYFFSSILLFPSFVSWARSFYRFIYLFTPLLLSFSFFPLSLRFFLLYCADSFEVVVTHF